MSFLSIDKQIDQAIQVLKHLKCEVQSSQVAENENGVEQTSIANLEKRIVELSLENKRLYSYIESLEDRIDAYIEKNLENIIPSRVQVENVYISDV